MLFISRLAACFVLFTALSLGTDAASCKVTTAQGDVFDFSELSTTETTVKLDNASGDFELHSIFCGISKATTTCTKDKAAFCFTESGDDYVSAARWQQESDIKSATTTDTGVKFVLENLVDSAFGDVYMTVEMNCAKKASLPVAEHPAGQKPYTISYNQDHPAACKGAAGAGGLSGGSVFLIIFFVLAFVYVAAGCAWNWKRNGLALGKEACPQRAFWAAVGSNCVAGVRFTKGGCKKTNNYEASSDPAHNEL